MSLEEIDYLFMDGNTASSVFVQSAGKKLFPQVDSEDLDEEAKGGIEVIMKERK